MSIIRSSSAELEAFFATGAVPTSDNFVDVIKSFAVYDGTLPTISASSTGTGSFPLLLTKLLSASSGTTISLGSSLVPDLNKVYNLGSSTKKINRAFISQLSGSGTAGSASLTASVHIVPGIDDNYDLGSHDYKWKDLYIDGRAYIDVLDVQPSGGLHFTSSNAVQIITASFTHGISSSIVPDATHTYNLGSNTKRWNETYVRHLTSSADHITTTASVHITPGTNNFYDLGGAGNNAWRDLFVSGTAKIATLSVSALDNGVSITGISSSTQLLEISGTILPSSDKTYDLGSSTRQYNVGHITTASVAHIQSKTGAIVLLSGSLVPQDDNNWDLGSSTKEFKDLYIDGIAYVDEVRGDLISGSSVVTPLALINVLSSSNATSLSGSGPVISSSATIVPTTDDTYDLGSATNEWRNLYLDGVAFIDSASITTASIGVFESTLKPSLDDSFDLGSTNNKWKDLFIDGTANIDVAAIATGSISQLTGHIIPSSATTLNLGSYLLPFKSLSVSHITSSQALKISGSGTTAVYLENTGNITASGNILFGSSISNSHTFKGNITASGNISASGIIFASSFQSNGLPSESISFNDNLNIDGNITASKNISASGELYFSASQNSSTSYRVLVYDTSTGRAYHTGSYGGSSGGGSSLWSSNSNKIYYNTDNVGIGTNDPGEKLEVVGNISASGDLNARNITSSGTITSTGIITAPNLNSNPTTISTNTTIPANFNTVLFVSNYNPSITIPAGVEYTISAGADVTIINVFS